jgi:hypothetical protein
VKHSDAVARALGEIVPLLATVVRELVHGELHADDGDLWVPHTQWPCSSLRAARDLARSGALEGVRRLDHRAAPDDERGGRGVLFIARRSALERYIAERSKPIAKVRRAADDVPVSGVAGLLAEFNLEAVEPPAANDARRPAPAAGDVKRSRGGRR